MKNNSKMNHLTLNLSHMRLLFTLKSLLRYNLLSFQILIQNKYKSHKPIKYYRTIQKI